MRSHTSLAGLVAALAAGACASAPARRASEGERVCIDRRDINTIRALDDRHAFVKVRAGHFHLLTVDKTCRGMSLARSIGIMEATTRVCGDGFSFLAFEEPTVGSMSCRIERIEPVADQNAAEELIRSRE
jgi:hypothetical protein